MENHSKDVLFKILSGFVGILTIVIIYLVFFGPLSNYTASLYYSRTVSVSASDKVTAIPDIANLSFSVVTEGSDISAITNDNNSKVNNAIAMAKQNGVDEKDIQTTDYSLVPVYTQAGVYSYGFVPTIAKYQLTQTVALKVRDFLKISTVLNSLIALKINSTGGISFTIDDPEKYLVDARAKAFQKAHDKALIMAQQNGLSLGKIVSVSDYSSGYAVPYKTNLGIGGGAAMAESIAPMIQPGSQEITANVNITYEIK
jgi:hypothetical protein